VEIAFYELKEIVPGYRTTVRSEDVAAAVALKGPHEHGAPACPSEKGVQV
jgi:hypothetical protein